MKAAPLLPNYFATSDMKGLFLEPRQVELRVITRKDIRIIAKRQI